MHGFMRPAFVPTTLLLRAFPALGAVACALLALGPAAAAQEQAASPQPAFAQSLAAAGPPAVADTAHLVRLTLPPAALAALVRDLDLDLAAVLPDGSAQVIAYASDLAALDARGIAWRMDIADLRAHYAARLLQGEALAQQPTSALGGGITPPFGQGAMGGYYTYDQVVAILDQLHAQYPAIVSTKVAIGTSIQGRTLWAVKVSDNAGVDEAEPETRIDALHHAREPESMQVALWFLLFLVENYGSDPLATYIVNARETWFVPVVNPDGYVYNQSTDPAGGGLWRKNRRNNGDGTFGVDPNRNYAYKWGFDNVGSSPDTSSDIYRGTAPASEPEVSAMTAFIAAHPFRTSLSLHTYSDLWLLPYGYANVLPDNYAQYLEVGGVAVAANGYALGTVPALLYLANGGSMDLEEAQHDTLAISPEIGNDSDGFWPPTSRIVPLAEENLPGLQATALSAGAWVRVLDVQLVDEGDGDGAFENGENVGLIVHLRNSGRDATAGAVTATLAVSGTGASVVDGAHDFGVVPSFASTDNAASPLLIALGPSQSGPTIDYDVAVTYEGWTQVVSGTFLTGKARTLLFDDLETSYGWIAGVAGDNATSGLWVRANPVGTTSGGELVAPEDDATPGAGVIAYVTGNGGGSSSNDDVDNGKTTLLSPPLDLSDMGPALLGWSRWYEDLTVDDDPFEASVSADGGQSWGTLESVGNQGPGWTPVTYAVTGVAPQSAAMRLRFVARDQPNNSVVEAGVDDVLVRVYDDRARCLVWGTPQPGAKLSFNVAADAGSSVTWLVSALPGFLQIPSLAQPLLLDVNTMLAFLTGTAPANGLLALTLALPFSPSLSGVTIYFQAYVKLGGSKQLTNRQQITVL